MEKPLEFKSPTEPILDETKKEKEPTMRVNEKALHNSYIDKHLMGKGISAEDILNCLNDGTEVTAEIKNPRMGSRYFKLDVPNGAGMPGRFVLPDLDGPLGGEIANWNHACEFKFRHGKLAPVIRKDELPEWLINFESVLYVIIEENQLPDGKLQVMDGPTNKDPEGSWMVSTAHFGQPSRLKPRTPKDCSDAKKLKQYLEDLDGWAREQDRIVFTDLEVDGQVGLAQESFTSDDENFEQKRMIKYQGDQIKLLQKQIEELRKLIQKK